MTEYNRDKRMLYYIDLVASRGYSIKDFLEIILDLEEKLYSKPTIEHFSAEFLAKWIKHIGINTSSFLDNI